MGKKVSIILMCAGILALLVYLAYPSAPGQPLFDKLGIGEGDGRASALQGRRVDGHQGEMLTNGTDNPSSGAPGSKGARLGAGGLAAKLDHIKTASRLSESVEGDEASSAEEEEPAQATPEEEKVLLMYDAIVEVLEKNASDCEAMSKALNATIDEHSSSVKNLVTSRADLDEDEIKVSQKRLNRAEGERMQEIRDKLKEGLTKCKRNEGLVEAVRKLARLNQR